MIELVGSIGWGLLAMGAISHVWHHRRLRQLLAMHLDHERAPALALTALEVALVVVIAGALVTNHSMLPLLAVSGLVLAGGFVVWIARLLLTGSDLPCACSFSAAPTSWWSLARAMCVGLVGLLAFVDTSAPVDEPSVVTTMAVGWAVAAGIFVMPEALTWPVASRALLARVDAYTTSFDPDDVTVATRPPARRLPEIAATDADSGATSS